MGKSLCRAVIFAFLTFLAADSFRKKIDTSGTKKCTAAGQKGPAQGLSISWPVEKVIVECGLARHDATEGMTYEFKFSEAFDVSFNKKCDCSINGETIVSFKAKNLQEAKDCKANAELCNDCKDTCKQCKADQMKMKRQCWSAYMRGRGTMFHKVGAMRVPEYRVPWMSGDFAVLKEGECVDAECHDIKVPGVLASMDRDDLKVIGDAMKKIMDGKKDEVPKNLLEMIAILPTKARDDAEFEQIDVDGDKTLTIEELSNYFHTWDPPVLDKFIKEVDDNGNGSVDKTEFYKFKEKLRNYDPSVDLIDGPIDFLISPGSGDIREVMPEWKAATVVCMKGGVPAPGECDGIDQKDAIKAFNTEC